MLSLPAFFLRPSLPQDGIWVMAAHTGSQAEEVPHIQHCNLILLSVTSASSTMALVCVVVTACQASSTKVLSGVCSWPFEVCIVTWLSQGLGFSLNSFPIQVLLVLNTALIFSYIFFLASSLGILHSTVPIEDILCLGCLLGRSNISLLISLPHRLNKNICILFILPGSHSRLRKPPLSLCMIWGILVCCFSLWK